MTPLLVGVLGGTGAVGRVVAKRLDDGDTTRVRIGARSTGVDLHDDAALAAFCRGCAVVVNAAGPSYVVRDRVARAALSAGSHYVDAAGDAPLLDALRTDPPAALAERAALVSAGVAPGLSGMLPRLLTVVPGVTRLDSYVGGATPVGPLAAVDVLLTRGPRFGVPGALRRAGRTVPDALPRLDGVTLPGFDAPVHAWPYLPAELAALPFDGEIRAYAVYTSRRVPDALARAWTELPHPDAGSTTGAEVDPTTSSGVNTVLVRHAGALSDATHADAAEHGAAFTILLAARRGPGSGGPRRVLLRTADSFALSGVVATEVVRQLVDGVIAPGAAAAAERIDVQRLAGALRGDPVLDHFEIS